MFETLKKPEYSLDQIIDEFKKEYETFEKNNYKTTDYKLILDLYESFNIKDLENTYNDSFTTRDLNVIEENYDLSRIRDFKMQSFWKTIRKNNVIKTIKNKTVNICPCCEIEFKEDKEKSIEHVLPKSLYNHYVILPNNLVPICTYCNNNKGSDIDLEDTLFFHPYYSSIEYSIENVDIKLLDNNRQHFQYQFILNGDPDISVKHNFKKVYQISASYRERFKNREQQIKNDIKRLSKEYKSIEEAKIFTKRIIKKELSAIDENESPGLNHINKLVFSLYMNNFDTFFKLKIKPLLPELEESKEKEMIIE